MTDAEPGDGRTEFNPLLFPPCACPRHRARVDPEPDEESASLRRLRARVAEENAARRWVRGQS